jgi:signal transduction histidine kinase
VYDHHDIFVEADKTRRTQVISNLPNNAVKFTWTNVDGGGAIRIINVKAEKIDGQAIVSIKDTGKRIHPEIMRTLKSLH